MRTPTFQEIISNPATAYIPKSVIARHAIAMLLIEETKTAEQFTAVTQYILRKEFSSEYSILVMIEVTKKHSSLLNEEAFKDWAKGEKAMILEP